MSRDAFRRLALLAGCTAYAVAIVVVNRYLGWQASLAGAVVGPLLTVVLTLEEQPPRKEPQQEPPEGLSRREIQQRFPARSEHGAPWLDGE